MSNLKCQSANLKMQHIHPLGQPVLAVPNLATPLHPVLLCLALQKSALPRNWRIPEFGVIDRWGFTTSEAFCKTWFNDRW